MIGDNTNNTKTSYSSDGTAWQEYNKPSQTDAVWPNNGYMKAVAFNSNIYVYGGQNNSGSVSQEIYRSGDGENWTKESDGAFTASTKHRMVVVGGTLYMVVVGASAGNSVWKSGDGTTWVQVTDNGGFTARQGHQVAALGNYMYLVGGSDGQPDGTVYKDVWRSSDGAVWRQGYAGTFR
ncbi:MAG: DUF6242 domain-containing protein [Spirochaetota bacterium]